MSSHLISLLLVIATFIIQYLGQSPQRSIYENCDGKRAYDSMGKYGANSFLSVSCFICTYHFCDYNEGSCGKMSSSVLIPMYTNVLEYGIMTKYFPGIIQAYVLFQSDCFVEIRMERETKNSVNIKLMQCSSPIKCKNIKDLEQAPITDSLAISFVMKVNSQKNIYFRVNFSPILSSALPSRGNRDIIATTCQFNNDTKLSAVFHVFPKAKFAPKLNDSYVPTGIPIAVPCSPGGYAIDPDTGKFSTNFEYIKKAFHNYSLYQISQQLFLPNEYGDFPSTPGTYNSSEKRPIYISPEGTVLSMDEMYKLPDRTYPAEGVTEEEPEPGDEPNSKELLLSNKWFMYTIYFICNAILKHLSS